MRADMPDGTLPSSVRLGQEQLAFLEGSRIQGHPGQSVAALRAVSSNVGATFTLGGTDVADADQKILAALLADSGLGSLPNAALLGDEDFYKSNDRGIAPLIASRTTGHKVFEGVVELVAVNVINDQAASTGRSPNPGDWLLAPVAGMSSWPNGIEEHGTMLQDESALSGHRMSMSSNLLVSSQLNPPENVSRLRIPSLNPKTQGGPSCRAR